jgi:hypothetical protein
MDGMRETIFDFYKREVAPEGQVNLNAHKAFVNKYSEASSVFFNKNEMALFSKPGGIQKALIARQKANDALIKKINTTFDAQISNLKPGGLMSFVMDANNTSKSQLLMEMIENRPELKRAMRSQMIKEITERTAGQYKNGERFFSPAGLDKFLNGKGGDKGFSRVVKNVMGEQYIKDLNTLNNAVKLVTQEGQFPNRSNTAFWIDTVKNLSRAYVGLFTRPGRFITAADRLRGRAANRVMYNAMTNPEDMRKLISTKGMDLRSRQAMAIIGSLGGSALFQDFGSDVERTDVQVPIGVTEQ